MCIFKSNATGNVTETILDHDNFQVVLFYFTIYFVKECNLKTCSFFGLSIARFFHSLIFRDKITITA